MTKVVRIADEAERIALLWGSSVSKGIIQMNDLIEQDGVRTTKLEEAIGAITKTYSAPLVRFDDAYWKRLKEVVSCKDQVPKLQPASHIKYDSKIEEDEKLIEPVGRQGRELR